MGKLEQVGSGAEGRWFVAPDVEQLKMAAEAWLRAAVKDGPANRLFLDLFAVYLVKHFRAEETRLQRSGDPGLAWHRREHRRLVRRVWDLMGDAALGLEVTGVIHSFLEAWDLHQISTALRGDVRPSIGH